MAFVVIGTVVAFVAWTIATQSWAIGRVWGPVVRKARGRTWLAAVLSVVLYITGLLAFGLVWGVAHALVGGLAAKVVVLLLIVAYTPVAMMPIPDRASSPYRDVRRGLVKAGRPASRRGPPRGRPGR